MRIFANIGILVLGLTDQVWAGPADTSTQPVTEPEITRLASASVTKSLRPAIRPLDLKANEAPVQLVASNPEFQSWIQEFKGRATTRGIDALVLAKAFSGISYDADIIRRDRNQSEFTKTIWDYLDSAVSETRIRNGKAALNANRRKLETIEDRYGVEKEVVVAIWGLESAYGTYRGSTNTIEALATLAFDSRRGQFFEGQLIAALSILQNGDTTAGNMLGSWAGAMGHTQFMPTSYLDYAVDFTGDGKRDIWSDDPSDALASTAAYLAHFGWTKDQPWGVEVVLEDGFDYRLADRKIEKSPDEWAILGVHGTDGKAVQDHGKASILLPAGGGGAVFMIFNNFSVIERYNTADAYVIGVGHLADRIGGAPPFKTEWPRSDRALTFAERKELQRRLTAAGFNTKKIDGKIGPLTIDAVRAFQVAFDLVPDGYASLRLLEKLR